MSENLTAIKDPNFIVQKRFDFIQRLYHEGLWTVFYNIVNDHKILSDPDAFGTSSSGFLQESFDFYKKEAFQTDGNGHMFFDDSVLEVISDEIKEERDPIKKKLLGYLHSLFINIRLLIKYGEYYKDNISNLSADRIVETSLDNNIDGLLDKLMLINITDVLGQSEIVTNIVILIHDYLAKHNGQNSEYMAKLLKKIYHIFRITGMGAGIDILWLYNNGFTIGSRFSYTNKLRPAREFTITQYFHTGFVAEDEDGSTISIPYEPSWILDAINSGYMILDAEISEAEA